MLEKKNFDPLMISWIKKINEGGKGNININGEQGSFFKTFRGLRQGDPLSPLLFNLVGDALAIILDKAKESGVLKGLVPDLIPSGITHLQYADDTILFAQVSDQNILSLKFLLFCFEEMSGMKINYQKSEMYVLGVSKEEEMRVANMMNCKVGEMPFTYLGLSMSTKKIVMKDLCYIIQKVEKRMQSWKSGYLSYGGREIKINSCLSSAPLYAMGFYYLPEGFHSKMDSARSRFYWQGIGEKKKYHVIRWDALCRPKDFGGMGFMDTRVMNICLLSKWIMKLESGATDMCFEVLRRKYMRGSFFQSSNVGGSQF